MSDLDITITNPDGQTVKPILTSLPSYDEYLDRPRRLQAKIEKGSGLDPQGTVLVARKGKIIFLGHVTKFEQSNSSYDSLTLDSAEKLLDERIGQFYRYPAGKTINQMLSEQLGGSVVGLLAMANSLVPRGSFVLHSGYVYKMIGAGTSSRIGTITAVYQNTTLLTKATSIPTNAGKWYQDTTDLYVWCTDSRDPAYHLVLVPNFKDTLVRLGTISTGTTTFTVCFEVGPNKIFPTVKALMLAGGIEYSLRYEKDGYAYLDGSVAIGKGSSSEPVATYIHGKNAEISVGQADGLGKIQVLLGQGVGAGFTQQCAAAFDLSQRGTWREAIYQAGGLFGSMLRGAVSKVFSDYQDPTIYNVRTPTQDWSQSVGNYVGIIRDGYQPVIRRIKHIQMRTAGDMLLECGQRLRTIQELLKSGEEVQQILSSFYGAHTKNAWSWSFPEENIDSYTGISHQFLLASTDDSQKSSDDKTIGSGEIDPNFPYMVLLNLKIGWYNSSVTSAVVPGQVHSNVGSHGGYGGGTSSKTQSKHSVNSVGNQAAATAYAINGGSSFCYNNGAHAHGGSGYTTGFGGTPAHSHVYYGNSGSAGTHAHDVSVTLTGFVVPTQYLTPAHNTNDAEAQNHEWGTQGGSGGSANTRAGSSQHPDQDLKDDNQKLNFLLNHLPTGHSIHYLTLDVKVNNVRVPGSPFSGNLGTGLYVGDSLDNIDITNLVAVGQKNSITYAISEFGGSNVVRCSLSGNVNVNAVISAF